MLGIITGNGKGKTTSAIGTAIRGLGWGYRNAVVFFDKGGSHYGEQYAFDHLKDHIDVFRFGLQRFDEEKQKFRFENTPEDIEEATRGINHVLELFEKKYFLVICDELINCLNLGLTTEDQVREIIEKCPAETHLYLTGRNVPDWIAEKADLISEVNEVKHHFKVVKKALKGIDY